jgi:hypothetical protein
MLVYSEQTTTKSKGNQSPKKTILSTNTLFITTPNSSKEDPRWETFKALCKHENAMLAAIEKKDIKEEISQIIGLAEVFRERGFNGEAYQELMCAITSAERLSLVQFDPQCNIIFCWLIV